MKSKCNSNSNTHDPFIALDVSYQLIEALTEIVPTIQSNDRDLADQIRRAATSVSLNLAEGQRSMKGNRQRHYAIAHGSANEVKAGLFAAKRMGLDRWERSSTRDHGSLARPALEAHAPSELIKAPKAPADYCGSRSGCGPAAVRLRSGCGSGSRSLREP
jgi:four helix bundle protein